MERFCKIVAMIMTFGLLLGCGQSKSSSLEGKVVDGKGAPMAKVKVIAKQVQPIKGYEHFEATTGEDGKFAFKGLFPISTYEIFPYWDNQTSSVHIRVESGPEGHTKELPNHMKIRFTKGKDGVISDNAREREWYVGPNQSTGWNQAKSWTESLSAGGGGWRMPTIIELMSLHQGRESENKIDPIFECTGPYVWSGQMKDAASAWAFRISDGNDVDLPLAPAFDQRAFAVRSRK